MERFYSHLYLFSFHPFRAALIARRCLTRSLVARPLWPHTQKKTNRENSFVQVIQPGPKLAYTLLRTGRSLCEQSAGVDNTWPISGFCFGPAPARRFSLRNRKSLRAPLYNRSNLLCGSLCIRPLVCAIVRRLFWEHLYAEDEWIYLFIALPPVNLAWGSIALA